MPTLQFTPQNLGLNLGPGHVDHKLKHHQIYHGETTKLTSFGHAKLGFLCMPVEGGMKIFDWLSF